MKIDYSMFFKIALKKKRKTYKNLRFLDKFILRKSKKFPQASHFRLKAGFVRNSIDAYRKARKVKVGRFGVA
jgi:hypothetical protein